MPAEGSPEALARAIEAVVRLCTERDDVEVTLSVRPAAEDERALGTGDVSTPDALLGTAHVTMRTHTEQDGILESGDEGWHIDLVHLPVYEIEVDLP